jgi:hypothetical protein
MDRDRRLTGYLRGQTDNPSAPAGFELNNPWRVSRKAISFVDCLLIFCFTAREAHPLDCLVDPTTLHMSWSQGENIRNPNPRTSFCCDLCVRNDEIHLLIRV